ncbi:MAG: HzsA-related protein [Planctomycetota bacterium]
MPARIKECAIGLFVADVIIFLVGLSLLFAPLACGDLAKATIEPDKTVEIVFAIRQPKGPHWYENMGYAITDVNDKAYGSRGYLCKLNLRTGEVTLLLEDPQGAVRDPQVHYDGEKILFSYRRGGTDYFHLYEINADGSRLKQLTNGPFDDIEPTYLPDGGIIFCSTRARRWVPCWYTQVATLYRCDGDGSNIHMLSSNIEQDNTPWVLPDGRIMYTRWEYVDRSREHFHHLWVMNPDGTGQMTYYGNLHPGDVYLDAKPIPDAERIVMVNSPKHGQVEHQGRVSLVGTNLGPDDKTAQDMIHTGRDFRDPYPLSPDSILVAEKTRLLLMNSRGETRELYRLSPELARGGAWLHEPRPLHPRPREPVIPPRTDLTQSAGHLIVLDIYIGRNMEGIERGAIKKLLILENLPKPVNFTGSMDPISYGGSYTLNRVLGTVPVEPDGSVNMKVPPLRSLQFVALDENDLAVKRMLSFLTVMPGEVTTCTGCHEDRTMAPPLVPTVQALKRPSSRITPIPGTPEIFDYPRDIQSILDKHCLRCHDVNEYAGRVLLTGDQGPMFTHSYFTLSARLQMADGRDLARGNYPPYTIGSSASPLMEMLDPSHYDVRPTPHELRMVKLWIDASATFPGTYAALGSGMIGSYAALQYDTKEEPDYSSWPSMKAAGGVLDRRCASCHSDQRRLPRHPADNLELRLHHMVYGKGSPRFWTPPWVEPYDSTRRVGSLSWMKKYTDPRIQFSRHILYNLSRPEKSLLLLAPLAKGAGGYGICGPVFESTDDADFRILLAAISDAKVYLEKITRFNMPNFLPAPEYVREMQRFGILPTDYQPGDPIDVYETDRKYWQSMWHRPTPTGRVRRSTPAGPRDAGKASRRGSPGAPRQVRSP